MEFMIIEGVPDYSKLIELIRAEWPEEFGEKTDNEMVEDMIKSHDPDKDRSFLLEDAGAVIGFCRCTAWPRSARLTDTAHTYDIVILPDRQGEGLGTLLLNRMMKDCISQGFKRLLSRSFLTNEGSIRLHERCGFIESIRTEDSIVWEKYLSSE
ncbi:MAG: GNAT family N-acetyltransferase [Spirochaetales bacterium]|uniref:GNAT family N-acetyltransferase n=1 Tax=Candidatus Thalassospirochaeta sargassi TaxID=3119039 RepID=A0AAJ1IBV1_9SPIO|nr:GNAT family N-acetyltransferase [Spirochaetales bacterium]